MNSSASSSVPTIIRAGCIALITIGAVSAAVSTQAIFSPKTARCELSRSWIEDANKDKKKYNDVDTDGTKADDVKCEDAVRLADQIRTSKDNPKKTASVPSEGAVRTQGALVCLVGIASGVAGIVTLRTLSARARTFALGLAAAGLLFQVLGFVSMALEIFVLYALGFSRDAKWAWPRATRGRAGPDPDDPVDV